ncbi:MAG: dsRBD fold-containing protein [Methanofastidiosum sp.]|jgi:hypothetical protein
MSKRRKFVGVQFVETVRVGKRTFAFGIYHDAKVGRVPFAGLAEKNPADKENPARGRNLAIGRALESLGKEVQKKEWASLKRTANGKPSSGKKLSAKEKQVLIGTPEAVAKREARAKRNAQKSTKTSKPATKKNTKVSKEN